MDTIEKAKARAIRAAESGTPCAVYHLNLHSANGYVAREFNGNWNHPDLVFAFGATTPDVDN